MINLEKRALIDFMSQCLESKPEIVVPIPSEGVAWINLCLHQILSSGSKIIYSDVLRTSDSEIFNGKRVLIIDFAVYHGTMMNIVVNRFLAYGASVQTAAFAVHEECPDELTPNKYYAKVDSDTYRVLKDEFVGVYLQEPHPSYSDHWDIMFKLVPFHLDDFIACLARIGSIFQVSEPDDPINRITVELNSKYWTERLGFTKSPHLDSVCKARFFIDSATQQVSLVGLFFPPVAVQEHGKTHKCPVPTKELSICEVLQELGQTSTSRDCFDSCSLFANLALVRSVLHAIRVQCPTVTIEPVVSTGARALFAAQFPFVADLLWPRVQDFIWGELGRTYDALEPFAAPSFDEHIESTFVPDSYAHATVATRVYRLWEDAVKAQPVHEIGGSESLGVSFDTLFSDLQGQMSRRAISRSIDVLLDVGIIRPVVTTIGIEKHRSSNRLWTRAYRPAGEFVRRSLRQLTMLRAGQI